MRISAISGRILNQIRHDKRTLALILIAPIVVLTLIYFVFNNSKENYTIALIGDIHELKNEISSSEDYDITFISATSVSQGENAVIEEKAIAAIKAGDNLKDISVYIDGSDSASAAKIIGLIKQSAAKISKSQLSSMSVKYSEPKIETIYMFGSSKTNLFDAMGAPLIGIMIFFFVFLIAGINFLTERSSGTLEKLLTTPIKRGEIISGYVIGFGILAMIQTIIVSFYTVYILGMSMEGSIWLLLLINLLTAMCALTLGMLCSTMAASEFQMIQFIPIIILPQIFLCGLFKLSGGWDIAGHFVPLYYTTDALTKVMLRGDGFDKIYVDCIVIAVFSAIFMLINIRFLRKQRAI